MVPSVNSTFVSLRCFWGCFYGCLPWMLLVQRAAPSWAFAVTGCGSFAPETWESWRWCLEFQFWVLFLGKSQVLFAVMVVSAALLCPLELSILLPGPAVTPSSCFLPARTSHLHSAEVPSLLFLVPIVICSFCLYSIPWVLWSPSPGMFPVWLFVSSCSGSGSVLTVNIAYSAEASLYRTFNPPQQARDLLFCSGCGGSLWDSWWFFVFCSWCCCGLSWEKEYEVYKLMLVIGIAIDREAHQASHFWRRRQVQHSWKRLILTSLFHLFNHYTN